MLTGCGESDKQKPSKTDSIKKNMDNVKDISGEKKGKYAVSVYPTPVLNTGDFNSVYGGKDFKSLKRNKDGLIKELEYVAYPGTVFEIIEEYKKKDYSILKVHLDEYDIPELNIELFIDSRFVDIKEKRPENRKINKPKINEIYDFFNRSIGSLYVWGANNLFGVDKMLIYYPPGGNLSEKEKKEWGIKGLDCSGLLYEATNGFTPRHTRQLVYFGKPVKIEGLKVKEIAEKLNPLDLIVWKGHIIIVYDKNTTIESSFKAGGVIKKNLFEVLNELLKKRKPVNEWSDENPKSFVIRRWAHLLNN